MRKHERRRMTKRILTTLLCLSLVFANTDYTAMASWLPAEEPSEVMGAPEEAAGEQEGAAVEQQEAVGEQQEAAGEPEKSAGQLEKSEMTPSVMVGDGTEEGQGQVCVPEDGTQVGEYGRGETGTGEATVEGGSSQEVTQTGGSEGQGSSVVSGDEIEVGAATIAESSEGSSGEGAGLEKDPSHGAGDTPEPYLTGEGTEDNPFHIGNERDWDLLVINVAAGLSCDSWYVLDDDVTVDEMVGTSEHPFSGHFNGNQKKLTVNLTGTEDYTAPFRYVQGASISNLKVTGSIFSAYSYAAGIVACSNDDTYILSCLSTVNIVGEESTESKENVQSNQSNYIGGLVGHNVSGRLTIYDCIYAGSILGHAEGGGGFVGCNEGEVSAASCLFDPESLTENNKNSYTLISESAMGTYVLTGCYYVTPFGKTLDQGRMVYKNPNDVPAYGPEFTVEKILEQDIYIPYSVTEDDFTALEEKVYKIATVADMRLLSGLVENGDCEGLTFLLTDDIDYSGQTFYPIGKQIGDSLYLFNGTFDGDGHIIRGIDYEADGYVGLFNNLDVCGVVKNVILDDSMFCGGQELGGIVGLNFGSVENCHVLSGVSLMGTEKSIDIGGISGCTMYGSIQNCTSAASIYGVGDVEDGYVGGIVGCAMGCTVLDNLTIGAWLSECSKAGAVAGFTLYATLQQNYYSQCDVNGIKSKVGVGGNTGDVSIDNGAMPLDGYVVTAYGSITANEEQRISEIAPYYIYQANDTVTLGYQGEIPQGQCVKYYVNDANGEDVAVSVINGVSTFVMPKSNVNVAAEFVGDPARAISIATAFKGKFQMNFYLYLPESLTSDEGAYAMFTGGSTDKKIMLSSLQGTETEEGIKYKLSYDVYAKEVRDVINLRLYYGNDELVEIVSATGTKDYTETGIETSLLTYLDYCSTSSDEKLVALAEAAKNYCTAVQINFGYKAEGLSFAEELDDVTEETLKDYAAKITGTMPAGVSVDSISAIFEADNSFRLYLKFDGSVAPGKYKYYVNDKAVKLKSAGGKYYLEVKNVGSNHLDDDVKFTITRGTKSCDVTVSVLTYARSCVLYGTGNLPKLAKALYLYNQAAVAKFGK